MLYRRPLVALVLSLGLAGPLAAQADRSPPDWVAAAHATCIEQFNDSRCDNQAHLEAEARTLATRDVARRAAVRGNQQERRAVRELLTHHPKLCAVQLHQYCRERGACSRDALALCDRIAAQRQQCSLQAAQFCRQNGVRNCNAVLERQCPSKADDVDELLARYPGLNATQQSRLRQLAHQLESNDGSQLGTALRTLLGLFGLR